MHQMQKAIVWEMNLTASKSPRQCELDGAGLKVRTAMLNDEYLNWQMAVSKGFDGFFELAVKGHLTTEDELDDWMFARFNKGVSVKEAIKQLHLLNGVKMFDCLDYLKFCAEIHRLLWHKEQQSLYTTYSDADAEYRLWTTFCAGASVENVFDLCDRT